LGQQTDDALEQGDTGGGGGREEAEATGKRTAEGTHSASKQPLMVRTFLKVYMELGSYFLFLQEQIKDIIIMRV
jgi:hypothetical protein